MVAIGFLGRTHRQCSTAPILEQILFTLFPVALNRLSPCVIIDGVVAGKPHRFGQENWARGALGIVAGALFRPVLSIGRRTSAWAGDFTRFVHPATAWSQMRTASGEIATLPLAAPRRP